MKKITKITGIILSLLVVLSCISVSFVSAAGEVYSYSCFDGKATISRCQTSARGRIEIPSAYIIENAMYTCIAGCGYENERLMYVCPDCGLVSDRYMAECSDRSCGSKEGYRTDICPDCKEENAILPKDVSVPITEIGNGAFRDCMNITEIVIPSTVKKIGNDVFKNCTSLEKVTFMGSECEIGKSAFAFCNRLKEIDLPETIKAIPDNAFDTCTSLESINISDSVELIGNDAFKMCENLRQIDIPASVKFIKKNAFIGCKSVSAFNVDDSNSVYSDIDGVLYGPFYDASDDSGEFTDDKALIQYPNAKSATTFTVPRDVDRIDDYAFGENVALTEITLPEGLDTIEPYAFYMCKNLSDINIPSTVRLIGSMAFSKCDSLKKAVIPASVENFESAFYASGLTEVVFENGVQKISTRAFENCSELSSVNIPESVKKIESGAFLNCTSLGEIEIPSSVTTIGTSAFGGCSSLTIIAEEGSAAYKYAEESGIPFSQKTEEVSFFQKIINAIIAFFEMIFSIFM